MITDVGSVEGLLSVLNKEVSGQLLAEYISEKQKELLLKNIDDKSNIKPRLSYIELILLTELYKLEKSKNVHSNNFKSDILKKYPQFKIVFEYIMNRLTKLGLVKTVNNPGYKLTEDGKKIVDTALRIYKPLEEAVIEDSFLGWLYKELEQL